MAGRPRSSQRFAVVLAFVVAAASFAAVALGWSRRGEVALLPLGGGLLMLVLAVKGLRRTRQDH